MCCSPLSLLKRLFPFFRSLLSFSRVRHTHTYTLALQRRSHERRVQRRHGACNRHATVDGVETGDQGDHADDVHCCRCCCCRRRDPDDEMSMTWTVSLLFFASFLPSFFLLLPPALASSLSCFLPLLPLAINERRKERVAAAARDTRGAGSVQQSNKGTQSGKNTRDTKTMMMTTTTTKDDNGSTGTRQ